MIKIVKFNSLQSAYMETAKQKSNIIVFIHGLFLNNESWTEWKNYFEAIGYTVYAPAYPGHTGNPVSLRANIDPELITAGFTDVMNVMNSFVDSLSEKPIVIGHSMGGLVAQKLAEAGKAVACVSIDGAPPKNVMPPFTTIKTTWPALNIFKNNSHAYLGTRKWYRKSFFNTVSEEESNSFYEKHAVPESRKIVKESAFSSASKINFKKPHVPLLFISGEMDAFFPPGFIKKIAGMYSDKNSIVQFKMFEKRSHFICGEKNWMQVADYINIWLCDVLNKIK
ncbi:Lysophospholipase, alpha-beta hydrolase superfamily [Chryseobacterium wanjuense]|uniref:Lysophospholipase, alpha-beta hydrolase superfamily n=2 Tax=Chryseobacterium wanjuense TaxID=356305 RepID=A0A1I0NMX7_9FLAO|nr:Lysophospholipase, alpha-beta hydrolase superfamily [Chryseobacterium wanjuense]